MEKMMRRWFIAISLAGLAASVVAMPAGASERYIISGASGHLGGLVVQELLRRGVPAKDLILVSHTPDKLAEFARLGASVRDGDVERPETLAPAYAGGTQMLMISVGFGLKEPRPVLHKRAFDAAVKAGVKHIVYTSFIGADTETTPVAQDHRLSEESLRASGAQWTILRNGEYADQWVLTTARKMVASGRAEVPPNERSRALVTYEDCAAAAASALLNPAAINQVYEITGPEAVTTADIARLTSEVTGRKIELVAGSAAAPPGPPTGPPPAGVTGPPPGTVVGSPPGAPGAPPAAKQFTAAQIAANATRFRQLTGRNPVLVKRLLEDHRTELLN